MAITSAADTSLLFSPIRIGDREVRNRIAMGSVTTAHARDGFVMPGHAAFLAARARGGAGMLITETFHVHPTSAAVGYGYLQISRDDFIEPARAIPEAVHRAGSLVIGQLGHMGRQWESGFSRQYQVAPSPRSAFPVFFEVAHELEVEEIAELVESFAAGARRIREAGFDGVELHGAHGLLIQQFLSPHTNFRTDQYGGSEESRLRFLREIIAAVRREIGDDFILGLKLSVDEFVPDGLGLEDSLRILARLEAESHLDYFLVAAGGFSAIETIHPTTHFEHSPFIENAAAVKRQSKLPVLAIGKINRAAEAEAILEQGKADVIAMARGLICDPELPNKILAGRPDLVRGCISCNECHGRVWVGKVIACTYNAAAGNEIEVGQTPAPTRKKKVVVVGGGPAGCEAAVVAAQRGHDVVLFEAEDHIGGRIELVGRVRTDYANVVRYYGVQLKELGVDVRLGRRVAAADVLAEAPDAVVVAAGTRPLWPEVPGGRGDHVIQMEDVIRGAEVGHRVVVWAEDQHAAPLAMADHLALDGHDVTLVTAYTFPGPEVEINTLTVLHRRLATSGVAVVADSGLIAIGDGSVNVRNRYTNAVHDIAADTVVACTPGAADPAVYRELKGRVPELSLVGDARAPRRLTAAVFEANRVARGL